MSNHSFGVAQDIVYSSSHTHIPSVPIPGQSHYINPGTYQFYNPPLQANQVTFSPAEQKGLSLAIEYGIAKSLGDLVFKYPEGYLDPWIQIEFKDSAIKMAIWRETGDVYRVGMDGAVEDDPFLQPDPYSIESEEDDAEISREGGTKIEVQNEDFLQEILKSKMRDLESQKRIMNNLKGR